ARLPPLQVRHEHLQPVLVGLRDQFGRPQMAAPLRALALELVLLPAAGALQLAGGGLLEALAGPPLRLPLRHVRSLDPPNSPGPLVTGRCATCVLPSADCCPRSRCPAPPRPSAGASSTRARCGPSRGP